MQFSYLFLVLAVAAVNSKKIDINSGVDEGLAKTNEYLRKYRFTSVHVPKGSWGSKVFFSDSEILGLDSLKRTDNCTLEIVDKNVTLDLHYGFGFFQQSFKLINIGEQDMSASFRIRDNSVHLNFTASYFGHNAQKCRVKLHDLSYERLAKVDFYSSRPELDGIDVEDVFEKEVTPFLNSKVDKAAVEQVMQAMCNQPHLEIAEQMPMIHMSVLQHLGIPSQL
ncbi:uncharacterized protein [Halyomorpha halys]|uniref:uncharacterized protein n=1 Tax=Halyomorpha halys TaxID=286706 RepID=UPI0006D50AFD|nr:uncharacterized protein LOC106682834 [Halyomorpha halys]